MDQVFFLQDNRGLVGENLMFWAVGGSYSSDIRKAEVFSKEQAVRQHQSRESDIPWPAEYVKSRLCTVVDMQDLRDVDPSSKDVAFYRQVAGHYIGNDILWVSENGARETTDLRLAATFASLQSDAVMWPVKEIQKIARPAVRARDVSIKDALKDSGIVLQRPKKPIRDVCKCYQCGRFLSEQQLWSGQCPKCGADNRP